MIKLAYNKSEPNLVFEIDSVIRTAMAGGVVEYYDGTLVDNSTTPATETSNYRVQVMGFESNWLEVPTNIGGSTEINNQDKPVTPTTSTQTITADEGYTGLGTVTVNPVTSAIDANIVPSNIKSGVTILGVTGTAEVVVNEMYWDNDFIEVEVNNSNTNSLSITGTSAFKNSISITSSNTSVAQVAYYEYWDDSYYVEISGVSEGTTTITATSSIAGISPVSFTVDVIAEPEPPTTYFDDKTVGDIEFTDAQVVWNNNTSHFTCTYTNTGNSTYYFNDAKIYVNLERNGSVITTLQGFVADGLEPGQSGTINSYHYANLTSADDVDYSFSAQAPEINWNYPTGEAPFEVEEGSSGSLSLSFAGFKASDYENELSIVSSDSNILSIDSFTVNRYYISANVTGVAEGTVTLTATIPTLSLTATGSADVIVPIDEDPLDGSEWE